MGVSRHVMRIDLNEPILNLPTTCIVGGYRATLSSPFTTPCVSLSRFHSKSTYCIPLSYQWLWYLTFSAQAFADVAVAVSLSVGLIRRRTGFRRHVMWQLLVNQKLILAYSRTDSIIKILVMYSINTCALTRSVAR